MLLAGWPENGLRFEDDLAKICEQGRPQYELVVMEAATDKGLALALQKWLSVAKRLVVFARTAQVAKVCRSFLKLNASGEDGKRHLFVQGAVDWEAFFDFLTGIGPDVQTGGTGRALLNSFFFIGQHPDVLDIKDQLVKLASSDVPVLLLGETGTGKGLIARLIHLLSPRSKASFVEINCAAITSSLMESELFGHKRGAFTGAVNDKLGKFQLSDQGTLFLDEISELSLANQAKLLQVLQENRFDVLGSEDSEQVDVRVIAATNVSPNVLRNQERLRSDLYFRLAGLTLQLPPLRHRKSDIPILAQYFWEKTTLEQKKTWRPLPEDVLDLFLEYHWPGNVRELQNVIGNMVVMESDRLVKKEIQSKLGKRNGGNELGWQALIGKSSLKAIVREEIRAVEKEWIKRAMQAAKGNKKKAAALIDLSYKSLLSKIKEYGL